MQVAKKLDLHPKTVRRYISEGKLKAQRVGGQWRIRARDLQLFAAGGTEALVQTGTQVTELSIVPAEPQGAPAMKMTVSVVVDILVADREDAVRLSNSLLAVMNTGDSDFKGARLNYLYYDGEKRARFMLWGQPLFACKIIEMIAVLAQ